jgi:hypothetical protein
MVPLILAALALPGHAHQLRAAITTALFNPRTGDIEVMHRFYSHDAEHALELLTGGGADLVDQYRDQLRFAVYVHEHFALSGIGAALEPLTLVGAELEGDYLWVYQRTPVPPGLNGLGVRFDALRELWPSQINTLNVERNGEVRTLTFDADDAELTVTF